MKTYFLSVLFLFIGHLSIGQISFNTGSSELDADLNTINLNAQKDISTFKAELSTSYNVASKEIEGMFSIGMKAAEVFLALEIAAIVNKPISVVVNSYKTNKSKGWGYIAKELGIKPGSAEFHQLKGNSKNKKEHGNSGNSSNSNNSGHGNSGGHGNSNKGGKK